jgi:hypothetical protein
MAALVAELYRSIAANTDFPEIAIFALGGLALSIIILIYFGFDLGALADRL